MKKLLKTIGYILLLLIIYFFFQVVVTVALLIFTGYSGFKEGALLTVILAVPLTLLVYLPIIKKKQFTVSNMGFKKKLSVKDILPLVLIAIALQFLNQYFLTFLNSFDFLQGAFKKFVESSEILNEGSFALKFIGIVICAPFIEELIFRVLIQKDLEKKKNIRFAIVVQAILFGLYHLLLIQAIYAFFIGLILGYLYYKTKSFWHVFTVHAVINLLTLVLSFIITDMPEGILMYLIIIISAIALYVSLRYYLKNGKQEMVINIKNMEEQTNET
jgi:membrane protease YdiL (CAAX protease family)